MRKSIKLLLLGLSMLSFGGVCVATSSVVVKPEVVVYAEGEEEQPQEETPIVVEEQPVEESGKESTSKPSQIATDITNFLNTPVGYTIIGTITTLITFAIIFSKTKVGRKVVKMLYSKIEEERVKREAAEIAIKEQEKKFKEFEKQYVEQLYELGKVIVVIGSKSRNPEIKEELKVLTVLVNELESEKNNGK